MRTLNFLCNAKDHFVLKKLKRFVQAMLLVSLLLTRVPVSYAQTPTDESATLPTHVFLPMIASEHADATPEQASEQLEENLIFTTTVADEEAILNTPAPDAVEAAGIHANYHVTKMTDTNDGVCDKDCSLREALEAAAADPTTYDQISLPAGTYVLTHDSLRLVNAQLIGADPKTTIIDGNNQYDILYTPKNISPAGLTNRVANVTLRNGNDGISHYTGTLRVTNIVAQNMLRTGVKSYREINGMEMPSLFVYNSIFTDNEDEGVRIVRAKGHIENTVVRGSDFPGVSITDNAQVTIVNSNISQNTDGIVIDQGSQAYIRNSTFTFSKVTPAISIDAASATIENSTIGANLRGGLEIKNSSTVKLNFVTIAKNRGYSDGYHHYTAGITVDATRNSVTMQNSLVADNQAQALATDCSGTILSGGYNLIENTNGCTLTGDPTGNITGKDPQLSPLVYQGATVTYYLPDKTSPAVDAIPANLCQGLTDQRGKVRPHKGYKVLGCDMGAIER